MTKICTIPGCEKKHNARGWCSTHYNNWKRRGDPLQFADPKVTKKKQSDSAKKRIKRDGVWNDGLTAETDARVAKYAKTLTGREFTKTHRENIGNSRIGISPWNDGLTTETDVRVAKSGKKQSKTKQASPPLAWNNGLTVETDIRVANSAKTLSKTKKKQVAEGTYKSPMKGKKHTDAAKKKNADKHRHPADPKTKALLKKQRNTKKGRENAKKAWEASRKAHAKPNKPEKRIGEILSTLGIKVTSKPRIDEKLLKPNEAKFHQMVRYKTLNNKYASKEIDIVWKDSMGNKKIIEYNGYAGRHCDPRDGFKPDDIQEVHNKPKRVQDIWNEEKMVLDQIRKEGYDVLVVWEYDFLKDFENEKKKILKFANSETLS